MRPAHHSLGKTAGERGQRLDQLRRNNLRGHNRELPPQLFNVIVNGASQFLGEFRSLRVILA
jgi:hypothetical protein